MTTAPHSVLIVDDDRFLASVLTRMLKTEGVATVFSAADGVAALAVMDAEQPQLVLCDLNMPGMDGLEFVRHLARYPMAPALVLMSGADRRILNTARQLSEAHQLSVVGVLTKPVTAADLRDVLARARPPSSASKSRAVPRLSVQAIEHGIAAGAIRAHYQPKICPRSRTVHGVEALLRWQCPEQGSVPPVAVIPVAEEHGLMDALTLGMLRAVLADCPRLLACKPGLTVAVNVSAENLNNLRFADEVIALVQQAGIDPASLVVEVTESRLIENIAKPAEILTRLRLKGVGVSIDDYGTGASTLQQLQRIPAQELKIDRSFVNGACHDAEALAMLESSVELARRLGLNTVAEGVENAEELALVTRVGCDLVQGYYLQRPLALEPLLDWMAAN